MSRHLQVFRAADCLYEHSTGELVEWGGGSGGDLGFMKTNEGRGGRGMHSCGFMLLSFSQTKPKHPATTLWIPSAFPSVVLPPPLSFYVSLTWPVAILRCRSLSRATNDSLCGSAKKRGSDLTAARSKPSLRSRSFCLLNVPGMESLWATTVTSQSRTKEVLQIDILLKIESGSAVGFEKKSS